MMRPTPRSEGACKLCGAGALRPVYAHPSGQQLLACRACGFRFLDGSDAAAWDYWATGGSTRNVDVYTDPEVVAADRARHDRDLDLIERQKSPGKLLDYGCGTGAFVERAEARGWTAGGVDVSASAVAHARAQGRPVWTLDEYRRLDDPRGHPPYDVITLWDVLEHLDDPHSVMRWLASQLREDGMLFVETPAWNHWAKRLALVVARASGGRLDGARFFVYPDHRLYFTERTLRRLLDAHGFAVVWSSRTTTSTAKLDAKLRHVHGSRRWLPLVSRVALAVIGATGGNKLLLGARKTHDGRSLEGRDSFKARSPGS